MLHVEATKADGYMGLIRSDVIFIMALLVATVTGCSGGTKTPIPVDGGTTDTSDGGGNSEDDQSLIDTESSSVDLIVDTDNREFVETDGSITRITSISANDSESVTVKLNVYMLGSDILESVRYTLKKRDNLISDILWTGEPGKFDSVGRVLTHNFDNPSQEKEWSQELVIGTPGGYTVSVWAEKNGQPIAPYLSQTFWVYPKSSEDPLARYEDMPIYIPPLATSRIVEVTGSAHPVDSQGIGPTKFEKVVPDTRNTWPRNSQIKVAVNLGTNRDRFHDASFYRSMPPLCISGDPYSRCEEKVTDWIISATRGWTEQGAITFVESNWNSADIRISFDGNRSYSILGYQDHLESLGNGERTMNFGWISRSTVLHEFGHALGFGHEQLSPLNDLEWNLPYATQHFMNKNGWSETHTSNQISNTFNRVTNPYYLVVDNVYDRESVMHYSVSFYAYKSDNPTELMLSNWRTICPEYITAQQPTKFSLCIPQNSVISEGDARGMRALYPKDEALDEDVKNRNAEWVMYSNALNEKAHAVLYELINPEIRASIYDDLERFGKLEYRVFRSPTGDLIERDCKDNILGILGELVGVCEVFLVGETYKVELRYRGEVLVERAFTVRGRREVTNSIGSSSFQASGSALLCSSVSCLSIAVAGF